MAAAAFGVLLISSALARLVFAQGEADRITYLAYAVALIAVAVATTVGVLRGTWRQAPVTDLVVQLGGDRSGAVRDALAQALGDPTLEVGYRDGDGYVDAAGRRLTLPGQARRGPRPWCGIWADRSPCWCTTRRSSPMPRCSTPSRPPPDSSPATTACAPTSRRGWPTSRAPGGGSSWRPTPSAGASPSGWPTVPSRSWPSWPTGCARTKSGSSGEGVVRVRAELERTRHDLRRFAAGLHPVGGGGIEPALRDLAARCPVATRVRVSGPPPPAEVAEAVWFVGAEAVTNAVKHAAAALHRHRADRGRRRGRY